MTGRASAAACRRRDDHARADRGGRVKRDDVKDAFAKEHLDATVDVTHLRVAATVTIGKAQKPGQIAWVDGLAEALAPHAVEAATMRA